MKTIAIIPARSGSKGVPGKNIKKIHGEPLISWSIRSALSTPEIDGVFVSTDSQEIADIALKEGAAVPSLRPHDLAQDESSVEEGLLYVYQKWFIGQNIEKIVLLQPTSPLRLAGSISKAITQFENLRADSLISVIEKHIFFWRNIQDPRSVYDHKNRPRRQDIAHEDRLFEENGSIYIFKPEGLIANNNRISGKKVLFEMDECESLQIDSHTDFIILEALMGAMDYAKNK